MSRDRRGFRDNRGRGNIKEIITEKCKNKLDYPLKPNLYESLIKSLLKNELKPRDLKTSQIRQVLTGISQIWQKYDLRKNDTEWLMDEVFKIKTKLVYAAGRKTTVMNLSYVLLPLLDKIKDWKNFEDFFVFFQAFIAYHKYYGGKD